MLESNLVQLSVPRGREGDTDRQTCIGVISSPALCAKREIDRQWPARLNYGCLHTHAPVHTQRVSTLFRECEDSQKQGKERDKERKKEQRNVSQSETKYYSVIST